MARAHAHGSTAMWGALSSLTPLRGLESLVRVRVSTPFASHAHAARPERGTAVQAVVRICHGGGLVDVRQRISAAARARRVRGPRRTHLLPPQRLLLLRPLPGLGGRVRRSGGRCQLARVREYPSASRLLVPGASTSLGARGAPGGGWRKALSAAVGLPLTARGELHWYSHQGGGAGRTAGIDPAT
jgi:hypothetical protein